jgi:hypothetical protein
VYAAPLAGCSWSPADWWDCAKEAAAEVGEWAGDVASELVRGIGYALIAPILFGALVVDRIAGTSTFRWVDRRIVRGYIERAAEVVGRIVEKVLSDPKLLAICAAAVVSCVGTALGAAPLAAACKYAGSMAIKGLITAGIAAASTELEPYIGETGAELVNAGAKSYADTHNGQTPPPPTLAALRSDALAEARRIYDDTIGAAVNNAGQLIDKVSAPAFAALAGLPVRDLRANLPDVFGPVLAVGRIVAAAGVSTTAAAEALTVGTRGVLNTAARALLRRPNEWDRIVGGMRAQLAAMRAQSVAWAIDDAAAVAVPSVPALTERAAKLRAAGLRIDLRAEYAAGRAYLDIITAQPLRSPGSIATTAPIWTVESIGAGRVGPVSALDALRAQRDGIAAAPTFENVRRVLAGNDRTRAARGGADSFPVGAERLRDAIAAALDAAPQAPRPVAEIAARIGPDVARRLSLPLTAPNLPRLPGPRPDLTRADVRPLVVPPVISPRPPAPAPPRVRRVDVAPASGENLPLPLLAAAGLGVALLIGARRA